MNVIGVLGGRERGGEGKDGKKYRSRITPKSWPEQLEEWNFRFAKVGRWEGADLRNESEKQKFN